MRKVWIVVCTSSQAKIFKALDTHKLVEIKDLQHPESKMHDADLVSDRKGRETGRFPSHAMELKTAPHVKECQRFAEEIATHLTEGHKKGEFERLYLIAPDAFLGYLHQVLDPHITKTIHAEIHKDLTKVTAEAIREYLPPVL